MLERKQMDSEIKKMSFKEAGEDPGFLVARGRFNGETKEKRESQEKSHRSKLANAIYMSIMNHGYANIRAVGSNAIANAVRSITSTTERCFKKNIYLYWGISVDKGNLGPLRQEGHVHNVTAYTFKLQHFEDKKDV